MATRLPVQDKLPTLSGPERAALFFAFGQEMATALLKVSKDANFEVLRAELIKGYRTIRPIDVSTLDLFMALRAATYVGWIITRMNEDGGHVRNARFIATARDHAMTFLKA